MAAYSGQNLSISCVKPFVVTWYISGNICSEQNSRLTVMSSLLGVDSAVFFTRTSWSTFLSRFSPSSLSSPPTCATTAAHTLPSSSSFSSAHRTLTACPSVRVYVCISSSLPPQSNFPLAQSGRQTDTYSKLCSFPPLLSSSAPTPLRMGMVAPICWQADHSFLPFDRPPSILTGCDTRFNPKVGYPTLGCRILPSPVASDPPGWASPTKR